MHCLFEQGDMLNSPYEAFIFDTSKMSFPVRQHWHYYMEILYMLEGTALITCGEKEYILQPHDMIALPPKELHGIYATTNEALRYYVLKFDLNRFRENIYFIPQIKSMIMQAGLDEHSPIFFTASDLRRYPVDSYLRNCGEEYEAKNFGYHAAMHASIMCLLIAMIRAWRAKGFQPSKQILQPADSAIDTITEYIDAHSHQPLHVEDLAIRCNMSYSFFAKKFKQLYGRSCKEYIEYIRVTKAEDMLLFTDCDLTYISQETGFSDCSHMIKTFKKYKNITPKQYRMQNTKSSIKAST